MYLDGVERVLRGGLAGHQLRHRGFHRAPLDAGVFHPSQSVDERAGRFGPADHVGDLLLHHLKLPDGLPERPALSGIGERQVDGTLSLTHASGRDRETPGVEGRAQNRKTAPHLAQHRVVTHNHVIEVHFSHVVAL